MVPCLLLFATLAAPELVDAARFEGALLAGSANDGLFRVLDDGTLDPVDLGLADGEERIRAVEVSGDILWLGTEAGLILVARDMCGITVHRRSDVPIADLSAGPRGLAVAAEDGVYLLDGTEETWRVSNRFSLVTWWLGKIVAGGAEGVFEVDDEGARPLGRSGEVTALAPDGERLLVGGADGSVVALAGEGAALVANLDTPVTLVWSHDDSIWIGGVGVPLLRVPAHASAERLPVASGTVRALVASADHVLALTDGGLATVETDVACPWAVDHAGAAAPREESDGV